VCCILFGHLIERSGYLPRLLGVLLAIAGYGYVGFSVTQLISPAFAARVLFPWVFPVAFIAESALCLWLLAKGVDSSKWNEGAKRDG
jgi:nitrate/nitrite transporter NarK